MADTETLADLIQVMDENPPLREAFIARLLPPELLGLPPQVAELVAAMNQYAQANRKQFDAQDQRAEHHEQANKEQFDAQDRRAAEHAQANKEQFDAIDARFDAQDRRAEQHERANKEQFAILTEQVAANTRQIAANSQQISDLDQKVEKYQQANTARFDAQDRRMEEHERANEQRFRRIENDLSYLKGSHARSAALEDAAVIAEEMGLEYIRSLTRLELYRMVQNADTTGIPANALNSFRHADLIMEAVNAAGETCYIAVEISFTADERDTSRAIRNAGFLTRFTGREAHSAVAGVYQDNDIQPQIAAGAVFWHHLLREDMEAE